VTEPSVTITAEAVAWYAAIVATAALAVQTVNLWRDRPRIRVSANLGQRVTPGGPYQPDTDYIVITVANSGRRPRTIEKVGFTQRLPGKSQPIIALGDSALWGPRELAEGRSAMWLIVQDDVTADEIEEVWAYDQTGKKYSGKVRP